MDHHQMNLNQSGHILLTRENHLVREANFDLTQFEPLLATTNSFRKEEKPIPIVINWKIQGAHSDLGWEIARSNTVRKNAFVFGQRRW